MRWKLEDSMSLRFFIGYLIWDENWRTIPRVEFKVFRLATSLLPSWIYIGYIYGYILFFWPLRLRKSSTRDVLNRFSVNVVRFDGPLVIYDLWGCGLVPSSQRSVSDFSRGGLETETRRGIGGFVELSGNTREILIEKGML